MGALLTNLEQHAVPFGGLYHVPRSLHGIGHRFLAEYGDPGIQARDCHVPMRRRNCDVDDEIRNGRGKDTSQVRAGGETGHAEKRRCVLYDVLTGVYPGHQVHSLLCP
jgi:hypothetical protein